MNSDTGAPAVKLTLKEGVDVLGGYSVGFIARDITANVTVINDQAAAGGTSGDPRAPILADTGITSATLVEGFTITGGKWP